MIGRVFGKGFSFKGPLLYAERGPLDSLNPDRVDWIYSRNLPTEDPETAARIMAATARGAHSRQAPVYHFSISFDPNDPVNREMMMQVADRTLAALRLEEHQVVIVAHRDRPHPHMHVVVNRVHPETLKVWSTWYDYPRIERALREQELELGLRVTPGRLAKVPGHPELRPKPRLQRGDADFLRDVQERAGPVLERALSWAELERGLAEEGLAVRVNHGGMCVTDGRRQVKASAVGREYSRKNLEKRFGAFTDYRARISVVEIPSVAGGRKPAEKELPNDSREATPEQRPSRSSVPNRKMVVPPASKHESGSQPSQAVWAPGPVRPPEPPRPIAPRSTPALSPREAALREFYAELTDLYVDPRAALHEFEREVYNWGAERAVRALRLDPQRFGALLPGVGRESVIWANDSARAYGKIYETEEIEAALKHSAECFRVADAANRAREGIMAALKAYNDATAVHDELRRRTAAAGAAKDRLVGAMKPIYQAPATAADALLAHGLAPGGLETAKAILRTSPESFGALRPDERSGWAALKPRDTFKNAKAAASQLDWPLENAVWTVGSAPTREQLRRAAMEAEQRLEAVDVAREARAAVSGLSDKDLMRRAALSLEPLRRFMDGDELELRLGRVLNATALKLLPKAIGVLIKLAEGPQRGHGHELGL